MITNTVELVVVSNIRPPRYASGEWIAMVVKGTNAALVGFWNSAN